MPAQSMLPTAAQIFGSGVAFVAFCALVFWPLEELLEAEKTARPMLKDLVYLWFYQSLGLWMAAGIVYEIAYLLRLGFPHPWIPLVQHLPFWLQVTVALFLAEVWVYLAHRLSHRCEFLWKFHQVHHTVTEMTWSASSRQHPVDFLFIVVGANLPALVLGIDLRSIAFFIVLERVYTVLLHANLKFDWGWFSHIVASPSLHRVHHMPEGNRKNYAGILSLLDWLGNTYQAPPKNPSETIPTQD